MLERNLNRSLTQETRTFVKTRKEPFISFIEKFLRHLMPKEIKEKKPVAAFFKLFRKLINSTLFQFCYFYSANIIAKSYQQKANTKNKKWKQINCVRGEERNIAFFVGTFFSSVLLRSFNVNSSSLFKRSERKRKKQKAVLIKMQF